MIGQKRLLNQIQQQIEDGTFPRFSIIVGKRGSETQQIGSYVAKLLDANLVYALDTKVDTIRDIILASYRVASTTVYNIINADAMSAQASNALLKITEEPPNKAYFIITVENPINLLSTIRSRGTTFYFDNYTSDEILDYYHSISDKDDTDVIKKLCDTPGEVDLLCKMNTREFYDFVESVVENVAVVNGCNAFKIAQRIQFKDSDEGYDLMMFWKAFRQICFERNLISAIDCTGSYLSAVGIKSINKHMLFDAWLLDIRKVLDYGNN